MRSFKTETKGMYVAEQVWRDNYCLVADSPNARRASRYKEQRLLAQNLRESSRVYTYTILNALTL